MEKYKLFHGIPVSISTFIFVLIISLTESRTRIYNDVIVRMHGKNMLLYFDDVDAYGIFNFPSSEFQ